MMLRRALTLYFGLLLALWAATAGADGKQYFHIMSGSGFFVSDDGSNSYAITNAHVVKGCTQVIIQNNDLSNATGQVLAADPQHDLALIYIANYHPYEEAPLRHNIGSMQAGARVYAIGYPGSAWKSGQYKVSQSTVLSVSGTQNHPDWIVFANSVQHGNSGSPLLDNSGNVVGVVVAGLYRDAQAKEADNQPDAQPHAAADAAISLATLEDFLAAQNVQFSDHSSFVQFSEQGVEDAARNYVINVICRVPVTPEQVSAAQTTPQALGAQ